MKKTSAFVAFGVLVALAGCGDDKPKAVASKVVSGFRFEITVEPSTFAPKKVGAVRVASDGNPDTNPVGTVQLFTPNDSLTWLDGPEGDVFGFDVELTNFYRTKLCDVRVVVDKVTPNKGHAFMADDRGTEYAGDATGQGIWAYGDVGASKSFTRRWNIALHSRDRFVLSGRVLADEDACGKTTL